MAGQDKGKPQKRALNWRGKSGSSAPAPSHGWLDARGTRLSQLTRKNEKWRLISVTLLFLAGIIGGASFLAAVLQREVQCPFITVVQTAYPRAFPPNSWSYEDIESLRSGMDSLDRRTINVVDLSGDHPSRDLLAVSAADERRRITKQALHTGVIVFYVSLHGLVNDQGQACVATSDSAPLDSSTWLPVSALLLQIKSWNLPARVHKVLILDCNRSDNNWRIGLLENTFAARLSQAFDEVPITNLAILNSASPGQLGLASAELRGSVFGQFLKLGLSGAADLSQEGGNQDQRVSMKELHQYLLKHVDGWAQANRGVHQQPLLMTRETSDFELTCSLDKSHLESLLARFASGSATEVAVSRGKLDELWAGFSELLGARADSSVPLEMAELRQRIVWLEQVSQAGAAYRLDAINAEGELRRLITRLRARLRRSDTLSPPGSRDDGYSDVWVPGLSPRLHSLPLLAQLGRVDSAKIADFHEAIHQLSADDSLSKLDSILANPSLHSSQVSPGIIQLLKLFQRSQQLCGDRVPATGSTASLIDLESLAATSTVPSDPRTQAWLRVPCSAADSFRRQADDAFLMGSIDSVTLDHAKQGFGNVLAIDKSIREAFELTDLIIAELPYLIGWIQFSQRKQNTSEPENTELADDLLKFVSAMHLLIKTLDSPSDADAAPTAANLTFLPQYRSLKNRYESLRKQFDDTCERIASSASLNPDLVREASALLYLPLLSTRTSESGLTPIEQRTKLQSACSQASRNLHRLFLEHATKPTLATEQSRTAIPAKDRKSESNRVDSQTMTPGRQLSAPFPILAILDAVAPDSVSQNKTSSSYGSAENDVGAGASIRRILKAIPQEIESVRERHLVSLDQPRLEWSRAARLARCWAPFMTSASQSNPVVELRRVDVQQLLLWHSQRYLDDFWGPIVPGEKSFFDIASTDSIEAAKLICIPNPATEKQIDSLKNLVAARRKAALDGLSLRADAVLLTELVENPEAHVSVMRRTRGKNEGLPLGTAGLRIVDQSGNLLGPTIDFPIEESISGEEIKQQELHLPLGTTQKELIDTVGTATAFFRGHEFHDDLVIKTAAGTTIETRLKPSYHARVRLNGEKRQRASVVFILDCSGSMQKGMAFESAESTVPRMEVAKAALIRMLNSLAARGDARVGVLLYGHRVGWSTKQPNLLMTQPTWGEPLPEGLKPYEDVETILPLGRFDGIVAANVTQRLEKVKPWGETPLYLSLIQALLEFKEDDPDVQRSVVVITDGVNYQFNPRFEMAKTVQDVLNVDASRHIPLYIVGFGIQDEEARGAQREFSKLANETNGQYVSVSEAAALTDALEGILQRKQYSAATPRGEVFKAPIGTAIDLSWDQGIPQDYSVAVDSLSETIEVTGGEAIELFISPDGSSINSAPYAAGAPVFEPLIGGSSHSPAGVRLGLHRPVRDTDAVTFNLSLQQIQQRFVRRPKEVWIEISPIFTDKRPATNHKYIIYDPDFVPQTPVPVLRATARGWPKDATRARIEFWCKWTTTDPSLVIPFSKLPASGQPATSPTAIDGIPGMKYQLRWKSGAPSQVDFIETYSPDVTSGTILKVDIVGSIAPSRTFHQFDEVNRFSTHSFFFDNINENILQSVDSIRVVSRRRMLDDALHLEYPAIIEVPPQSETLPASP